MPRPITTATMTEDEYLEFSRTALEKHEFVNGEVVAMSGASLSHDRLQINAVLALGNRLRRGPCRLHGSNMRVRLDETGLYCYPDLTIVCGEPDYAPTRPVTLLNPRVVIEILSESTEEYDRGAKLAHYRYRASVELIVLVDSRKRRVELIRRNADATWTWSDHVDGVVRILDHEIPLDELYEDVTPG